MWELKIGSIPNSFEGDQKTNKLLQMNWFVGLLREALSST
jgi:hypothetical protein